jgi:hypothetical protein
MSSILQVLGSPILSEHHNGCYFYPALHGLFLNSMALSTEISRQPSECPTLSSEIVFSPDRYMLTSGPRLTEEPWLCRKYSLSVLIENSVTQGLFCFSQADDLWGKAIITLSQEDRIELNVDRVEKLDVLDDLLSAALEKLSLCKAKQWKYKKGHREINIRDQLEKIIVWVNKFKEVGDIAMQYDPSHAALPWAGVRFLLQTTINDSQIFGAMVDGVECVSELITRYAILEKIYLKRDYTALAKDQLSQSIIKLYAGMLRYLSKAKQYFYQNAAGSLSEDW